MHRLKKNQKRYLFMSHDWSMIGAKLVVIPLSLPSFPFPLPLPLPLPLPYPYLSPLPQCIPAGQPRWRPEMPAIVFAASTFSKLVTFLFILSPTRFIVAPDRLVGNNSNNNNNTNIYDNLYNSLNNSDNKNTLIAALDYQVSCQSNVSLYVTFLSLSLNILFNKVFDLLTASLF